MTNTNVTSLRKDLFNIIDNVVKYNEKVIINTKDGNAIVMSEEEYNGIMATFEIYSNPKLHKNILEGVNAPLEDFIDEEDVDL